MCIVSNRPDALLRRIIDTVAAYADEVLIGYNSPDHGLPPAFDPGPALVIPLRWEGYGPTKNKLAQQASHKWILSLDGDELPDDSMLRALGALPWARLPAENIYTLKRLSFFEGKKIRHGAWGRDQVKRLYHREHSRWDQAAVHEDLETNAHTKVLDLPGALLHYTADDRHGFLEKNRKYAQLSAEKYFLRGKKSPLWKRWLSPAFTFFREYLLQGGILDGKAGYHIARIDAQYTYWKYLFLHQKYQESSS